MEITEAVRSVLTMTKYDYKHMKYHVCVRYSHGHVPSVLYNKHFYVIYDVSGQ